MSQEEAQADLVPPVEVENLEEKPITVSCEVRVFAQEGVATVTVPPELRLTERLVAFLHAALQQRGLELRHWTITLPEQERELENLPNVIMGKDRD